MPYSCRSARSIGSVILLGVAAAWLAACANTGVVPVPEAGTLENPLSGIAVRITQVEDQRGFQNYDGRNFTPTLTGDANDPIRRSHAIGRGTARNGRPGPNIFVAPDLTIEGLVKDAASRAFRSAGFRVLESGDSGYAHAIDVQLTIEKLWMMQSKPTEAPSTELDLRIRLAGPLPGLNVGVLIEGRKKVVRGGFSRGMWRQALEGGLDEFIVAAEAELVRVVAAVDATPARALAPSGLTVIPSESSPSEMGIRFGRYYLLAIGIDDYKSLPPLKTAISDARAVARLLSSAYGFETELLLNATRSDLIKAFSKYREKVGPRDNLVIYYAGHGWNDEEAGIGYWLPVDASSDDETNWVSNSKITSILRAMQAKHVMVVSDSGYSGTLTRGIQVTRTGPGYLERLAERRTRVALASGGNEPVADGGGGKHSVFANAFLRALEDNGSVLDATRLHALIRTPVMRDSEQIPQFGPIRRARHDDGDFLFVRTDSAGSVSE